MEPIPAPEMWSNINFAKLALFLSLGQPQAGFYAKTIKQDVQFTHTAAQIFAAQHLSAKPLNLGSPREKI